MKGDCKIGSGKESHHIEDINKKEQYRSGDRKEGEEHLS